MECGLTTAADGATRRPLILSVKPRAREGHASGWVSPPSIVRDLGACPSKAHGRLEVHMSSCFKYPLFRARIEVPRHARRRSVKGLQPTAAGAILSRHG